MMINYYQLSFPFPKRMCTGGGARNAEKTLGMTFLMEALPVASQLPRKLDVRAGDSQSHAAARANAPRNCCFGRKKKTCFDEEVLLFQGEEGKKKQAQQKAWQLAGVESDSSHRVLQMSEEILGCI